MSDLIDRDKAIEMINKTIKSNKSIHYEMKYWEDGMNCARQIVEGLPSAEPQIIRCKDCKYYQIDGNFMFCNSEGSMFAEVTESDFCSYAERRTE